MVRTPWGNSGELRERRLPPGRGTPPKAVRRNQRERLQGAMVAVASEKGYGATTVADLLSLSGVSRKAFYEHFDSKLDCMLATMGEIIAAALGVVASRYRRELRWEERAREALASFFALLADQPAASRLVLVESYAGGPRALALVEGARERFFSFAVEAMAQLPGREEMPETMIRAVIGGLREVIQTRLRRRDESELGELGSGLLEAALAYRTPPTTLHGTRRPRAQETPDGPLPPVSVPRSEDPAERIVAAAAAVMARHGYAASTLEGIAGEASASLSTLYEHFDGKEALLAAALDAGQERMFAAAAPVYRRARSWPEGVRGAVTAIFGFLAAEPDFARLGTVEVFSAGRWALERRERTVERFARFLEPGFAQRPEARAIAGELAVGAALAIAGEQVAAGEAASLPTLAPLATYIVLAPFVGSQAACEVARGGRWDGTATVGG